MDCTLYIELLPAVEEITDKPEDVCPVDWALRVADTARLNNCGQSVMCRDGMQQLYTIICDITTEKGQSEDIELISDVCEVIKQSEGCGVAARSAELISVSLERYADEWAGHIRRKRCTASVCEGYYSAQAIPERADGARRRKRKTSDSDD